MRFVLKDYEASVPENTPPGSVILTAGVNKVDPVSFPQKSNNINILYNIYIDDVFKEDFLNRI